MGKTTAPLLSIGASGQIAGTHVYSSWRGIPYVRRHVIPANPQTAEQTKTRNSFAWLSAVWKQAPALVTAPWDLYAVGQQFVGRNAFIGQNTKLLRAASDITTMVMSPGAKGGLSPTAATASGGVGTVTGAFTNPAAPAGWTLTSAVLAVASSQDPQSGTMYATKAAEDSAAKDAPVVNGLAAGDYQAFMWLKWAKPDGSVAYSPSITETVTVT